MVLDRPADAAAARRPAEPVPGAGQVLLRVQACGVCRTDLHVVDGEVRDRALPLRARPPDRRPARRHRRARRRAVAGLDLRDVPLLPRGPREPLRARAVHRQATSTAATPSTRSPTSASASPLPADATPTSQAAPLLCAGLIGYRALRDGRRRARALGLYGFGAAAHIVCQVARHEGRRGLRLHPARRRAQPGFARELGAVWAGDRRARARAARRRDHLRARRRARPGSRCARPRRAAPSSARGIHMSDIPSFPYADLWGERVAAVGRQPDPRGRRRSSWRSRRGCRCGPTVTTYPLERAQDALDDLRSGRPGGRRRDRPVEPGLGLVVLGELALEHLARRVARQLVEEDDLARHLVGRRGWTSRRP